MFRITEADAVNLISQGAKKFRIQIELDSFNKLQLYMTGRITKGVELFGIGPVEQIRGANFLFDYREITNYAIQNYYRVFVMKEGSYFGNGNWYLEFRKILTN
jgi:hypothetical protein